MVLREEYMEKLFTYLDAPLVKILAGIRRCGKSTILEMFAQVLKSRGINEKNTLDDFASGNVDGVKIMHLADFLLM